MPSAHRESETGRDAGTSLQDRSLRTTFGHTGLVRRVTPATADLGLGRKYSAQALQRFCPGCTDNVRTLNAWKKCEAMFAG